MPNISLTLSDIAQSVSRPMVLGIAAQVQDKTKIPRDAKVFFPGDIQKMRTAGSDIDTEPGRRAIFNTDRYIFIEVEEALDNEAIGTTAVSRDEQIPVFMDPGLGVYVTPVYATVQVTINFQYRTPSKNEAHKWLQDIRMRLSMLRDVDVHSIPYHYRLPGPALEVLKEVYDKREAVAPYGQTFAEYFTLHATPRLTVIGDLTGQHKELAISETQGRIIGLYGFEGVPEKPSRDDSTATYQVSFSYKFNYEQPIGVNLRYPVMVHNQLLNPEFIEFPYEEGDLNKTFKSFSQSMHAMHAFETDTQVNAKYWGDLSLTIPPYDDFTTPEKLNRSAPVFTLLCEVDSSDKRTLFNLGDLGEYGINDEVLEFIRLSEYSHMTKAYTSILQLELYRGQHRSSSSSLVVDADLNVRSSVPLDLRQSHRVRLSLVTDLTLLTQSAIRRLMAYPKALVAVLSSLNECLARSVNFRQLADYPQVYEWQFSEVYQALTGYSFVGGGSPYDNRLTGRPIKRLLGDIPERVLENLRLYNRTIKTSMICYTVAEHQPVKD